MRSSRRASFWACICSVVLAVGCAGGIARPTDSDAAWASGEWPGTTRVALEDGRDLYVHKCGGCHALHEPAKFPEAHWRERVDEMGNRAGLGPLEKDHILRYLVAISHAAAGR